MVLLGLKTTGNRPTGDKKAHEVIKERQAQLNSYHSQAGSAEKIEGAY